MPADERHRAQLQRQSLLSVVPGQAHGADLRKHHRPRATSRRAAATLGPHLPLRVARSARLRCPATEAAAKKFGVDGLDKEHTGNTIGDLRALRLDAVLAHDPRLPLPDWLTQYERFEEARSAELEIYSQIAQRVDELSDGREQEKARHLVRLLRKHDLVIAFDSCPLTLHVLRDRLAEHEDVQVLVATGGNRAAQRAVQRAFELGSDTRRAIALCSNALAEGVNLQQASALVHLDMPSVVRIAEQRVGRVDRMDSPWEVIESWWPRDAPEFALVADERLGARLELVGDLLGANVQLPTAPEQIVQPEVVIQELQRQESIQVNLLDDAFAPVRAFLEGPGQLISAETYLKLRRSEAKIVSAVATVRAARAWGFFAVQGSLRNAPRWVFVEGASGRVSAAIDQVAESLRASLAGCEDIELDQRAEKVLQGLVDQLENGAGLLLPRRKQRALAQLKSVLESYEQEAIERAEGDRLRVVQELRAMASDSAIDHDDLAEAWFAAIRSRWRELLAAQTKKRRRRALRLDNLTVELQRNPLSKDVLDRLREKVKFATPLAERIVAAIIGVPG